MSDIRWDVLTIGHLSRNKFWGESDDRAYRAPRCTTTLIRAGQRTIIVDPGCPSDEMIAVLDQRAGLTAAAIDTVFLTHFHGDHRVGIGAFPHARWQMAAQEIALWDAELAADSPDRAVLARIEPATDVLAPGLALLQTSGHTLGHTSLVFSSDGLRVVVAGDAVMTRDFFLACDYYFNTVDATAAVQSLNAIAALAEVVVPGHDNVFLNQRSLMG
jgi:glyoxylase-like metal-dependent hydrolase (beta-lactamase superfamily II)